MPVVLHCRDAYTDLIPELQRHFHGPPPHGRFWGVVHCFSGTPDAAVACAELGFALGADGPVTYPKNDSLREAFARVGPGATVLETDCPYLPPQSIRGKRHEPSSLPEIAARLAVWKMGWRKRLGHDCQRPGPVRSNLRPRLAVFCRGFWAGASSEASSLTAGGRSGLAVFASFLLS